MRDQFDSTADRRPLVVLIHGFGAKRTAMWILAKRLRVGGFRVETWGYASLFQRIEVHANRLTEFLLSRTSNEPTFHLVAHSMGCILVRQALCKSRFPNLGRVVFLAPPQRGSPIASIAARLIGTIIPPAAELSDLPNSYVNTLDTLSDLEIGTIAARHDMMVPVKNTELTGHKHHHVVVGTHNSLLWSSGVSKHVIAYLRTGCFQDS